MIPPCQPAAFPSGVSPLRGAGALLDFASLRSRVQDNAARFLLLPDAKKFVVG